MPDLRSRLQADLTASLRARDKATAAALRTTLSAIANAEAVPTEASLPADGSVIAGATAGLGSAEAPRRDLTEQDVLAIIAAERAELSAAATELEQHGATDRAAELHAAAAVLDAYLS